MAFAGFEEDEDIAAIDRYGIIAEDGLAIKSILLAFRTTGFFWGRLVPRSASATADLVENIFSHRIKC